MSSTNIHLIQLYLKTLAKKADFECRYIRTNTEQSLKFLTLHSPYCHFS